MPLGAVVCGQLKRLVASSNVHGSAFCPPVGAGAVPEVPPDDADCDAAVALASICVRSAVTFEVLSLTPDVSRPGSTAASEQANIAAQTVRYTAAGIAIAFFTTRSCESCGDTTLQWCGKLGVN